MGFRQFIEEAKCETPGDLIGLAVYFLMMFEGEEVVGSSTAYEFLKLHDFNVSRSATAAKLEQLKNEKSLKWMDREGAPSGYILTLQGVSQFEDLAPFNTTSENQTADEKEVQNGQPKANTTEWDVFISHASEDKEEFVEPLANNLEKRGLDVWYDDFEVSIGDSIPAEIDKGLSQSEYGIVVLSESFFQKDWPQEELNALTTKNVENPYNLILPIWYNIGKEAVSSYSPLLAQRRALKADPSEVESVSMKIQNEITGKETNSYGPKTGNQFDYETLEYIAELTADTWSGSDIKKLFKRIGCDVDWDDSKEGTIQEYIATFPVEAKEKGIDVDKAREDAVLNKLEELNTEDYHHVTDFIEKLSHPRSHLNQEERHQRIVDELNNILKFEGLRVDKNGEVQSID